MSVTQKVFGKTKQGEEVFLYSIKNAKGVTAEVTNYGAILVNLYVPDKNGNVEDIVLGYDKVEDYFENGCFFGATIGPNANRIANAKFSIDGVTYQLAVNDNQNNLHSDAELGYHKCLFNAKVLENEHSQDNAQECIQNISLVIIHTLLDLFNLKARTS